MEGRYIPMMLLVISRSSISRVAWECRLGSTSEAGWTGLIVVVGGEAGNL